MKKVYENDFKVMIVELLNSGRSAIELSNEYDVEYSNITRWRREFKAKSGDFSKRRELTPIEFKIVEDKIKKMLSLTYNHLDDIEG